MALKDDPNFPCPYCIAVFSDEESLLFHADRLHNLRMYLEKLKNYKRKMNISLHRKCENLRNRRDVILVPYTIYDTIIYRGN